MITHATFFGLLVAEPTTAITDFVLALLSFFFYFQLDDRQQQGASDWKLFFLFMGCSTLLGSFIHAFLENHDSPYYSVLWTLMQLLSGLSVYSAQLATIRSIPNDKIPIYRTVAKSILLCRIQFFAFAGLAILFQNFLVVVLNSTIGFLMVLYIHALSGKKYGNRPAWWIAIGIMVSFLTAIIYTFKISISSWFNFKDISHVIMMVSISFIFYGVALSFNLNEKTITKIE